MNETVMREEANERMSILADLGYCQQAVASFYNDGVVFCNSESSFWPLYEADKAVIGAVEWFENEYNSIAYACIIDVTHQVPRIVILYVDSEWEIWETDRKELRQGYSYACVINTTDFGVDFHSMNIFVSNAGSLYVLPVY